MSATKFCVLALLLSGVQSYKFEPLAGPSPGTATIATFTAAAGAVRSGTANEIGPYDTQAVAPGSLGEGQTTAVLSAATAVASSVTSVAAGAAITTNAMTSSLIATGNMGRSGLKIDGVFPTATAFTNGQAVGTEFADLYCAPGYDQTNSNEMVDTAVDCLAATPYVARTGSFNAGATNFGSQTTLSMAFPTQLTNAAHNGRWFCWIGTPYAAAGTTAHACTATGSGNGVWQKVFAMGTTTATPTPTPNYASPSPSSFSPSPSASPSSGAVTLSSCASLLIAGAIAFLWIQ